MHNVAWGVLLLVLAGIMNASFALPMKFVRGWPWEKTWLLWSCFALILLPAIAATSTIPGIVSLYRDHPQTVLAVAGLGCAWGIAQVLFGLALDRIGIALTFSIVLGLSAAMGSIIPLLRLHYDRIFSHNGLISLLGVALVLVGVSLSAAAGRIRDRVRSTELALNRYFGSGLIMAIAAGICAAMMNVGVSYGAPLAQSAIESGAHPGWTANAIWMPLMLGGALPNILYCVYLLVRRRATSSNERSSGLSNGALAFAMALLWFGSSLLYGVATIRLGELGAVVGWPLFMSLIVIVASLLGVWTGEWRNAPRQALKLQAGSVGILVCAVVVLSRITP